MPDVYLALRTVIANTQMLSERNTLLLVSCRALRIADE